jgi:hypothetical protein
MLYQIFDVPWNGMPVRRGINDLGSPAAEASPTAGGSKGSKPVNPIYSIVKHYLTPWQVKLMSEAAAASTVGSDNVSL